MKYEVYQKEKKQIIKIDDNYECLSPKTKAKTRMKGERFWKVNSLQHGPVAPEAVGQCVTMSWTVS